MSRPLLVQPEAEEELLMATRWYEERREGLGVEFVGTVQHALARVARAPARFAAWHADVRYRRAPVGRFPFVVIFEDRPDAIVVVAVAHTRRGPSYWIDRTQH